MPSCNPEAITAQTTLEGTGEGRTLQRVKQPFPHGCQAAKSSGTGAISG